MSRRHVPVTLPRARFDVSPDGHLTVTVDGRPWQPRPQIEGTTSKGPGLPLGRSDAPWAQQQIANDLDTPVRVETVEDGRSRTDIALPDRYQVTDPPRPQASDEARPGTYMPGEPVSIRVVVGQTHADEHGQVRYQLPAALADRAVLAHGEVSGTTLPLDRAPLPAQAGASKAPSRSPFMSHNPDVRRNQPHSGAALRPAEPAPALTHRDTPDDGLGAL